MAEKLPPLPFQPAPRPQSRLSPADAQRLTEVTADLGFTRASSPQEAQAAPPPPAALPAPQPPQPRPARSAPPKIVGPRRPAKPVPAQATGDGVALKFDVPSEVWTALKLEAIKRRVTVRYLVLEALSRVGYEVDLASVPEDGRRLR